MRTLTNIIPLIPQIPEIPWPFKIGILLAGIKFSMVGAILVLLDGIFHFTSPIEKLKRESPDWIIARNVFNTEALSETSHKIMGALLILGALTALMFLLNNAKNTKNIKTNLGVNFYLKVIQPVTLVIIATAILLKNITLRSNRSGSNNPNVAFLCFTNLQTF